MSCARPGWIFGSRADAWVFAAPLVLVALGGSLAVASGWSDDRPLGLSLVWGGVPVVLRWGMLFDFAYHVTLDAPHTLATVFRTYADPDEFVRRRGWFLALPPLLFVLLWFAATRSTIGTLRAVAYLNIFHYIRQQEGWVRIAARKAGESATPVAPDRHWDRAVVWALTAGPLLWWHGHPNGDGWLFAGDIQTLLTPLRANAALALALVVILAYCARALTARRSGRTPPSPAKRLQLGLTAFAWGGGIVFELAGERTYLLDVLHIVPYLSLVYFYGRAKWGAQASGWRAGLFRPGWRSPVRYLGVLIGVATIKFLWQLRSGAAYLDRPGLAGSAVLAALLLPAVLHYTLDAFVWRLGGQANAERRRLLGL